MLFISNFKLFSQILERATFMMETRVLSMTVKFKSLKNRLESPVRLVKPMATSAARDTKSFRNRKCSRELAPNHARLLRTFVLK